MLRSGVSSSFRQGLEIYLSSTVNFMNKKYKKMQRDKIQGKIKIVIMAERNAKKPTFTNTLSSWNMTRLDETSFAS